MRVAAALLLALTGCASSPQVEIPKEVRVPVPVACIAPQDRPQRPVLRSDAELLALDTYRRTWAVWSDRLARQAYEAELEVVVERCGRIPALKLDAR